MRTYVIQRLVIFVPVLFLVSVLIFVPLRILPGDPAMVILSGGGNVDVDPQDLARLRRELGLDFPLHQQYFTWIQDVLTLNLGTSLVSRKAVNGEIARSLPVSLELASLSTVFALLVALPVGILSAVRQDTWIDYVARSISIAGMAFPSFWIGTLVVVALVMLFKWIPPVVYATPAESLEDNLTHMIWPALVLGYQASAPLARMTRSALLDVRREDYVRTAWAKGLGERLVITRHMLKNALLPVIALSGVQIGRLLGGTVIMESIFVLPGLGRRLIEAVELRDFPMIQAIVLISAVAFMLINFLVDLVQVWLDPRVRLQ